MDLSMLGIVLALGLLIVICYKKFNPVAGTIVCVCVLALLSGMPVLDTVINTYFSGFAGFLQSNFLLFATGNIFAVVMDESGAAAAFAKMIYQKLGGRAAVYGCMVAIMILGFVGINGWALMFIAYPIFLCVFKQENLPRWMIPCVIYTSLAYQGSMFPGSPTILNILPMEYLGTGTMAGAFMGTATGLLCTALSVVYLEYEFRKARRTNDGFVITPDIAEKMRSFEETEMDKPWRSIIPMIVLLILLNGFNVNVNVALLIASALVVVLYWKTTPNKMQYLDDGIKRASMVIANTAAVVGFGTVVKATAGFQNLLDSLANMEGNPLISFGIATTLVAGATGSGSGGIAIAMATFAQKYLDMGCNPEAMHRIAAMACNGLDTLPHNSMVITCLVACGMSHKESYKPIFVTSVCITLIGLAFAIFLGIVFY